MTTKKAPRDVPSRDDFYMGMAFWAASKSKDPATQVGAVIISEDNVPLGWGYNGPPQGILDNSINWARPEKYDFICHAEENAMDHSVSNLENSVMYVTAEPCSRCMLRIVKFSFKKVVYYPMSNKVDKGSLLANKEIREKTSEIARLGGVTLSPFDGNLNWMRDRMKWMEMMGVFD
ncbi:MAG: cytidine deaminase [Crenarchaeota archaeon]|nr:MAG: cytidine deaminase [Thermoproteota archaeon]